MVERAQRHPSYHQQTIRQRNAEQPTASAEPSNRRCRRRQHYEPLPLDFAMIPRSGARKLVFECSAPKSFIQSQRMKSGPDNGQSRTGSGRSAGHKTVPGQEHSETERRTKCFYGKTYQQPTGNKQQNGQSGKRTGSWLNRKSNSISLQLQTHNKESEQQKPISLLELKTRTPRRSSLPNSWKEPKDDGAAAMTTLSADRQTTFAQTCQTPKKVVGEEEGREATEPEPLLLLLNLPRSAKRKGSIKEEDVRREMGRYGIVKLAYRCPVDGCQFLVQFDKNRQIERKRDGEDGWSNDETDSCCSKRSDIESACRLLMNGSFSPVGTPRKQSPISRFTKSENVIERILRMNKSKIILKGHVCKLAKPNKLQGNETNSLVEGPSPDRPTNRLPPTNASILSDIYWRYTQSLAEICRAEKQPQDVIGSAPLPSTAPSVRPRSGSTSTTSSSFVPPLLVIDNSSNSNYLPLAPPYHILPDTAFFRNATIIPPPTSWNEGLPILKRIHNRYIASMIYSDDLEAARLEYYENSKLTVMQKMEAEQSAELMASHSEALQAGYCSVAEPLYDVYGLSERGQLQERDWAGCEQMPPIIDEEPNIYYSENVFDFNLLSKKGFELWSPYLQPKMPYYTENNSSSNIYAYDNTTSVSPADFSDQTPPSSPIASVEECFWSPFNSPELCYGLVSSM